MGYFYREVIGTDDYYCYQTENEGVVDRIRCKMLENNHISGILPMIYSKMDNKHVLRYTVNGCSTLEEQLKECTTGMQQLMYLKSIVTVVSGLKDFMLDASMLQYDHSAIFVDEEGMIGMVCLPVIEEEHKGDFQEFCTNIIFSPQMIRDLRYTWYQELKSCVEQKEIDPKELASLLEKISLNAAIVLNKTAPGSNEPVVLNQNGRKSVPSIKKQIVLQADARKESIKSQQDNKNREQVVLSRLPEGKKLEIEKTMAASRGESGIVLERRNQQKQEENKMPSIYEEEATVCDKNLSRFVEEEATVGMTPDLKATLLRSRTRETIQLNQLMFRIGKSRYDNEYSIVDNPLVSRHHAEIYCRGSQYYIKDLMSKNTTFLNGTALIPEKEYKLTNNMVIRLANEEFVFQLN